MKRERMLELLSQKTLKSPDHVLCKENTTYHFFQDY